MPHTIEIPRITSSETPRQVIARDFKSLRGELPIRGGWGYTIEDAVIIDKNDPAVSKVIPFDGVGLEYIFAEKRIYEELVISRPLNGRFSGIRWELLRQNLQNHDEGRAFDFLVFEITAFPDRDFAALKAEWETQSTNADFDIMAHAAKREGKIVRYERDYWFDITSFFGK